MVLSGSETVELSLSKLIILSIVWDFHLPCRSSTVQTNIWHHFIPDELIIFFLSVQSLTHDNFRQVILFSALSVVIVEMILHRKMIK